MCPASLKTATRRRYADYPDQPGGGKFSRDHLKGLAPAGRLDIDSTGLLILTQDGRIARQLIGDDSSVEKEYLVRVSGQLSEDGLALLNHGLSLDGKQLRPAKVRWQNDDQLSFNWAKAASARSVACANWLASRWSASSAQAYRQGDARRPAAGAGALRPNERF
ncbi:MAG: pseudouridine synthase [Rhodocyclaceae bacterium]